jgi:hypothetical protein
VHELAEATWASFRQLNGNWWFFVEGKGGKLGHVPVNNQLLSIIKIYRLSQNMLPLPQANEQEPIFISQKTKQALGTRQLFRDVKEIGKLAARKFKDNIVKKQKLERLSPHWLRHLSASHQDLAGISGTIIQSNHRHNSFATTQIYLHAPDELRYREMQKIYMKISPKLYQEKSEPDVTRMKVTLTPSSLSNLDSFKRLVDAIENNLLSEYDYERDQPLDYIINHYETIKQFKQSFSLVYYVKDLSAEGVAYLKKAIAREAEIRLFECAIV